jgi:chlorobactene glucosyltransferase
MLAFLIGAAWAGLASYLLGRAMRQFRAYRATALAAASRAGPAKHVSIIVPARNEIANIARCLDGLLAQKGLDPRSSLIVVDDNSQDGTAAAVGRAVAAGAPIRTVPAGPLPRGWFGKPHACWRGASIAEGEWLCFVDADVEATPLLVASAVEAAERQGIDMLSLRPFQEFGGFWERLIMPAGLLVVACAKQADERAATENASNGQFILIRREVYREVGGHAAVRAEICEDNALAARVAQAGRHFRVLSAEQLARTRMYRDLASLWEGLSKNAVEILGSVRGTLAAAISSVIVGWAALAVPLALVLAALRHPVPLTLTGAALALFGSAIVLGAQLGTARYFRIPIWFGLVFALGYTLVAIVACRSVLLHRSGRVTWKGRTYELARKASPGRP